MTAIFWEVVVLLLVLGVLGFFAYDDIKSRRERESEARDRTAKPRHGSGDRVDAERDDEDTR